MLEQRPVVNDHGIAVVGSPDVELTVVPDGKLPANIHGNQVYVLARILHVRAR